MRIKIYPSPCKLNNDTLNLVEQDKTSFPSPHFRTGNTILFTTSIWTIYYKMVDEQRKDIDLKTMDEKNISTNFLSTKTDFSSIWQRKAIIKKSLVVHLELTTINITIQPWLFKERKYLKFSEIMDSTTPWANA